MAKRTKKRRSRRKFTLPIAPLIGVIAAPSVRGTIKHISSGNIDGALAGAGNIVGIQSDGKFNFGLLMANVTPMLIGVGVHKIVGNKLGMNRVLANAGVPIIRL